MINWQSIFLIQSRYAFTSVSLEIVATFTSIRVQNLLKFDLTKLMRVNIIRKQY